MDKVTKTLAELGLTAQNGDNTEVAGLAVDNRLVKEGYLFAALPGTKVHGAKFAGAAIEQGAVAVLTDPEGAALLRAQEGNDKTALVIAEDPRQTLAYAAALWFGEQPETMIAVTGTNGKTSVSTFARQIWVELGLEAVNLGTTGVEGVWSAPLKHTTPEPITLHRALSDAAKAGVTHAAMEASSHGLEQRRLDGVRLVAAGFSNFSQDHLDYHATFEDYFNAKMGLFTRVLPDDGTAVINLDDPRGADVLAIAQSRNLKIITVGRTEGADLCILGQRYEAASQELRFSWQGQVHQVQLNLIGGFQADNVMLAAGLVIAAGAAPERVFETLPHLGTVRGRMQLATRRQNGASLFVDFAHTPDAISTACRALRPHVMGRLIAIVGAGGDRDPIKRPLMGKAACENADAVIVTDDNPRTEDPATIRAAVMGGCATATEVGDRALAILRGADMLEPGDALLICGKGHESGQIVGEDVLPFDDCEQASLAVSALDGGAV